MLPTALTDEEIAEKGLTEDQIWMMDIDGELGGPYDKHLIESFIEQHPELKSGIKLCLFSQEEWQTLDQVPELAAVEAQAIEEKEEEEFDDAPTPVDQGPFIPENSNLPTQLQKNALEASRKEVLQQLHNSENTHYQKDNLVLSLAFLSNKKFEDREFVPDGKKEAGNVVLAEKPEPMAQTTESSPPETPPEPSHQMRQEMKTKKIDISSLMKDKRIWGATAAIVIMMMIFSGGEDNNDKRNKALAEKARQKMKNTGQRQPAEARPKPVTKQISAPTQRPPVNSKKNTINNKTQEALEKLKAKRKERSEKLGTHRSPKMMIDLHKDPEELARERMEKSLERERNQELENFGNTGRDMAGEVDQLDYDNEVNY
jgi:DNA uptake protein ComE-like DNA-binding protein